MQRPPPIHEFKPDFAGGGKLVGPPPAELGPVRYKRIIQLLVAGIIIGTVAAMLITVYYKARRPALMADCMGRLRMLAQAFEMYGMDHGQCAPPAASWRWAISEYVDMVGGQDEGVEEVRRLAKPRGFSSSMRCLANRTTYPISYFYVEPGDLGLSPQLGDEPTAPLLVDEMHHPKVIVLRQDSSCARLDPGVWVDQRGDYWQIARRPDWQYTFAYMSLRPAAIGPPMPLAGWEEGPAALQEQPRIP